MDRKVQALCCEGLSKEKSAPNRKKRGKYDLGDSWEGNEEKVCQISVRKEPVLDHCQVNKIDALEEGFAAEYEEIDEALEDASNSNILSEVKMMAVMSF